MSEQQEEQEQEQEQEQTMLMPLEPDRPEGSHKKVVYLVRHAEAVHNVREREAVRAAVAAGETSKERQDEARRSVLRLDPSLKDAPLSSDGTEQARASSAKLNALFDGGSGGPAATAAAPGGGSFDGVNAVSPDGGTVQLQSSTSGEGIAAGGISSSSPFRRPDVVLVSPLRRALMTATELFYNRSAKQQNGNGNQPPPKMVAIEALREKRTGLACDERSSVADLKAEFPHVDFSDIERGVPAVPEGEDNAAVRSRGAEFLDKRLAAVPGSCLAIVSHKGWLREHRRVLKERVEAGQLRANFDVNEWDKRLYGNAEVRVAAFRWQDGELVSVVSRSVDNAMLAQAAMMGDGFEFALGPPSSGFSIFLADRTTKVHFISISEGRHYVAIREAAEEAAAAEEEEAAAAAAAGVTANGSSSLPNGTSNSKRSKDDFLLRSPDKAAADHPLHDARLTAKGERQADKLREMLANRPSGGRPFTAFDLVVVSPLTRALETARQVFGETPGTYGGVEIPPPKILVKEECRERYGRYVCDGRRSVTDVRAEFPAFDFSEMIADVDVLHTDVRESSADVRNRALRLLQWLSARPERCVAVVTHSEFLRHLFGQFGDTLHEEDRCILQRTAANCELRSVVLCSHGAVERGEQAAETRPASTVRVPSSSGIADIAE